MFLNSIVLKNFRLHKNTSLNFSDKLNFIVGGNGQGKTSILEAIYYLCTTKSLNQSADNESINFDEEFFEIEGRFKDLTENKSRIYNSIESGRKAYFLDDKQVYRSADIIGKFPVVTLTQSDHDITLGSPSDRRKFVDSVISQASETYLKILIEYNKTLRQRSSLLTQIKETKNRRLFDQLDAWNDALIANGTEIVKHRFKFVDVFNEYLSESYYKIMESKEKPFIDYSFMDSKNIEDVKNVFTNALNDYRNDELRRGTNLVGPHRDEFLFKLNDYELRKFGSQGQHKTFQIALRFGQFFYMKDTLSRNPIFLMDDIFGELDTYRANKISNYLKEVGQAFITMTDFTKFEFLNKSDNDLLIKVSNGKAIVL